MSRAGKPAVYDTRKEVDFVIIGSGAAGVTCVAFASGCGCGCAAGCAG